MHCYGLSQWITDRFAAVVEVFFLSLYPCQSSPFTYFLLLLLLLIRERGRALGRSRRYKFDDALGSVVGTDKGSTGPEGVP